MSKLKITPDMGVQLKNFRNQYKVKAKDIATLLEKSGAYISKLEKGEIQQIEKQEFVKIVNYITQTDVGYYTFCEYVTELMNPEEMEKISFLLNFDWIDRKNPLPTQLVTYINGKLLKNGISVKELVDYINKNEDLDENFFKEQNIDKGTVEYNTWIPYVEMDGNVVDRNFILVHFKYDEIQEILDGKIKKTSYLIIYTMLYHIYKIEELKKRPILDEAIQKTLKKKTEKKLIEYKFYTFADKRKILAKAKEEIELQNALNSFDYKNRELMNKITESISILSEYDVDYMNKKLEGIYSNLSKDDPSFAIAYMAIALDKLEGKTVKVKRDFLKGIYELIEKCACIDDEEEIEKY